VHAATRTVTVVIDRDGGAYSINNQGQAPGYSGTCTSANHVVRWEKDGTVAPLDDLGVPGASQGIELTTKAKLLGKSLAPTAQPLMALFGSTMLWRICGLRDVVDDTQ
jgi:hypothetical protein